LKSLFVGIGISALLISGRQISRVFAVHLGGFPKTIDGFVPILVLGCLRSLPGNLRSLRISLLLRGLRNRKSKRRNEAESDNCFHVLAMLTFSRTKNSNPPLAIVQVE